MIHKNRFLGVGRAGRTSFIGLVLFLSAACLEDSGKSVAEAQAAAFRGDAPKIEEANSTNFLLRPIGPGAFEIGKVRLDKERNGVSFPAEMNLESGPIEYFLVHCSGKRHESILVTEAEPFHIQAALLLLGARGSAMFSSALSKAPSFASVPVPGEEPDGAIRKPSGVKLAGDPVRIELRWREGLKEFRRDAESFFLNQEGRSGGPQVGKWIYNGSRVVNGLFFAQTSGSVISLITDQDALINNEAPGHDKDDVWAVNTNNIPPLRTTVQVTILLPKNVGKK